MNLWKAKHRLFDALFRCNKPTPECRDRLIGDTRKPKAVVLDVDDTVLNWWSAFIAAQENRQFAENITQPFCGKPGSEWVEYAQAFNASNRFSNLRPLEDATCFILWLFDLGYRVVFLSACGASQTVYESRCRNITNALGITAPDFELISIPIGSSKISVMKDIQKTYDVKLFVDNMKPHCDAIERECGVKSIMMHSRETTAGDIEWITAYKLGLITADNVCGGDTSRGRKRYHTTVGDMLANMRTNREIVESFDELQRIMTFDK